MRNASTEALDKAKQQLENRNSHVPPCTCGGAQRIAKLEQQLRQAKVDTDRLNRLESHIENAHLRGTSTTFSGTGSASLRDLIDKMQPAGKAAVEAAIAKGMEGGQ